MAIEAILWEWQSDEDPIDYDGLCPECFGAGTAGDESDAPCPLCQGEGLYDEAFEALLRMPTDALAAYAGAAWDAAPPESDTIYRARRQRARRQEREKCTTSNPPKSPNDWDWLSRRSIDGYRKANCAA